MAYHTQGKPQSIVALFEALRAKILGLSDSVVERVQKHYITYAAPQTFCSIQLQKGQIKIWANIPVQRISGARIEVRDVSTVGHYGSGETEITMRNAAELESALGSSGGYTGGGRTGFRLSCLAETLLEEGLLIQRLLPLTVALDRIQLSSAG